MKVSLNERARELRKNSTDTENKMWYFLRNRQLNGYKFIRQHVIEPYIVDFICREKSIIIELDGGHHAENVIYDQERTLFLEAKGYKVLRFWNHEVLNNINSVLEIILISLGPSP
jgi:very-short-patch-repair endonuclease